MELLYVLILFIWWTGFLVGLVLMDHFRPTEIKVIAALVFWPLVAVGGLFLILWGIPFSSAKKIRTDLKNRGLLKEFNQWVKDKENEG